MSEEKKHADFQYPYKKSSNFKKVTKNEDFNTDGKGNLTKENNANSLSDLDKKNIANAMDKMRHDVEMIPGEYDKDEEE